MAVLPCDARPLLWIFADKVASCIQAFPLGYGHAVHSAGRVPALHVKCPPGFPLQRRKENVCAKVALVEAHVMTGRGGRKTPLQGVKLVSFVALNVCIACPFLTFNSHCAQVSRSLPLFRLDL